MNTGYLCACLKKISCKFEPEAGLPTTVLDSHNAQTASSTLKRSLLLWLLKRNLLPKSLISIVWYCLSPLTVLQALCQPQSVKTETKRSQSLTYPSLKPVKRIHVESLAMVMAGGYGQKIPCNSYIRSQGGACAGCCGGGDPGGCGGCGTGGCCGYESD